MNVAPCFKVLANRSWRGNMDQWLAVYYCVLDQWSQAQIHIRLYLTKRGLDGGQKPQTLHRQIRQSLQGLPEKR